MKKIILTFVFMLLCTITKANTINPATAISNFNTSPIVLNFNLGDVTYDSNKTSIKRIQKILKATIKKEDEFLECSVTVEASVGFDKNSISASVTVTGNCNEVQEAADGILSSLIAKMKDLDLLE